MKAPLTLLATCVLAAGIYIALGRGPNAAPTASDPGAPEAPNFDPTPTEVKVTVIERLRGPAPVRLPGVEVILHGLNDEGHVFSSGTTDADGSVTLSAPRGHLDYDGHAFTRVTARIRQPGYVPASTTVRLSWAKGPEAFLATLSTTNGWIQRIVIDGELVGNTHSPVSVRRVVSRGVQSVSGPLDGPSLEYDRDSRLRELGGGTYELLVRGSAAERWLIVDGGRNGRASWRVERSGKPGTGAEPIKLHLQGPAQLTGRVLNARGDPVAHLLLSATWVPPGAMAGQDALDEPFQTELARRGGGQFRQQARTNQAGQYSFTGLIEGTFRIDAARRTEVGWRYSNEPLGQQVASADPEPGEFEFTRPTIVVTVDSGLDKTPCDLVLFDAGPAGSTPWARPGRHAWHWSGLPVAGYFAKLDGPGSYEPNHDGRTGTFEVPKGRQYFLCAQGNGYEPAPQLVTLPSDDSPAAVAVGPPNERPMGTLRVQLTTLELEQPKDPGEWSGEVPQYGLFVQHVESAIPFGTYDAEALEQGPLELLLPAGPVRVVACGVPGHGHQHGNAASRRIYGRTEQIVDVQPGAVTTVTLELGGHGGRLAVTLTGEISAEDRAHQASEVARIEERNGSVDSDERQRILRGALHLENLSRRIYLPVNRTAVAMIDTTAEGEHTLNEWPMGETHTSNVLPPGPYTLRATFPRRAPVEMRVVVTDGGTTEVKLDFSD